MGKSLVEASSLAAELYAQADEILGWSVSEVSMEGPEEELTKTAICQPALFVHGYVVYRLLEAAGHLDGVAVAAGLSLGELTALTAAGALSFADGVRLVAERGRLMQLACDATEGTMASVIGGTEDAVRALCDAHDIDMANLNCPGQIVISGEKAKVVAAIAAASAERSFKLLKELNVAGAYHSRLMEPARLAFAEVLAECPIKKPSITVLSNTTGKAVHEPDQIRTALAEQVVSSVRWEDCIREAITMGVAQFYECGTGNVLAGLGRRIDRSVPVVSVANAADLKSLEQA
jgi:[acyl-carrier-protein] S-malonyltransferase